MHNKTSFILVIRWRDYDVVIRHYWTIVNFRPLYFEPSSFSFIYNILPANKYWKN